MDYTAVLSRLDVFFSGTSGVLAIAGIGILGIVGAHFVRMRATGAGKNPKSKSYRHVVIAPYEEDADKDPANGMMPHFSPDIK